MAELLLDFETSLTIIANGGFDSTSGGVSRVATGALGTSWKVQIDKASTGDDYGKVLGTSAPSWSSTTDFRFGLAINPNSVTSNATGKRVRIFHTSGSSDISLEMRMTNATTHKVVYYGGSTDNTTEHAITSADWSTVELWFEYDGITAGTFHIHLIINDATVQTLNSQTYTGNYARDWRIGAGDEISGPFDIVGNFFVDEVRFNNTGAALFSSSTPVEASQITDIESTGLITQSVITDIESKQLIELSQITDIESKQLIETSQITDIESIGEVLNTTKTSIESIGIVFDTQKTTIESTGLIETSQITDIESLESVEQSQVTDIENTSTGNAIQAFQISSIESKQSLISDDAPIHDISHEYGSIGDWYPTTTASNGGVVELHASAAAPGGSVGLRITPSTGGHEQSASVPTAKHTKEVKTLHFDINTNDFSLPNEKIFTFIDGIIGVNKVEGLQIQKDSGGTFQIRGFIKDEADVTVSTAWSNITAGIWIHGKLKLYAASSIGAGDGVVSLVMPGETLQVASVDYDMINYRPDSYRLGITPVDAFSGESGTLYLDNFRVDFLGGTSIESKQPIEISSVTTIESLQKHEVLQVTDIESLEDLEFSETTSIENLISVEAEQITSTEAYTDVTRSVVHPIDIRIANPIVLDIPVS